ncbi:MAG: DUF1815 family protein [Synechococcus sp. MED-G71]|nr:MAG: DUF1815 family protein [Synechococcus sp. MED-G71]
MFLRLAAQYQDLVKDLVLTLDALAQSLKSQGLMASCYTCGTDGNHGASFVADLRDGHAVRFLVCDYGISWVEMRNGVELVKLEGADAIRELDRLSQHLRSLQRHGLEATFSGAGWRSVGQPPAHRLDLSSPQPEG